MSLAYFTLLSQLDGKLVNLIDIETPQNGYFVLFQDSQCDELYLTCQAGAANHFQVIDTFYTLAELQGMSIRTLADYFNPVMSGQFQLKNRKLALEVKDLDALLSEDDLDTLLDELIRDSCYKQLELEKVAY